MLRFEPEPWTGPDVLVWVKMMAWDLSKNYSIELLRHDLLPTVGAGRTAELLPPYPPDGLTILSARDMPWMKPRSAKQRRPSGLQVTAALKGRASELRGPTRSLPRRFPAPALRSAPTTGSSTAR